MEQALTVRLRERVTASGGSIPFSAFMEDCLYHPDFGYYATGRQVVGRAGDFYTSVSTGALFGRLLADGFYQVWLELGRPAAWQIVEQGANRGDLAADVLARLRELDAAAWRACEYVIVEPFPALQEAQRRTLTVAGCAEKLRLAPSLSALPGHSIRGVLFSNELPDAFPVRCVKFGGGRWLERRVAWDAGGEKFVWHEEPCAPELWSTIQEWQIPALEGYCAEVSPLMVKWAGEAASRLSAGIFLTIDYGGTSEELYRLDRPAGTLRAYRQHQQMTEVLAAPGGQDLTAHVNFTRLIVSGARHGLRLQEYSDQHHYLVKLGQLRFFKEMEHAPSAKLLREYQTLTHPSTLGTVFKALTMTV